MSLSIVPLDRSGLASAQHTVTECHYLHRPVDVRCSPFGYGIEISREGRQYSTGAGYLILGRPEATCCGQWYGSVEDVRQGRCEVTRWQVINLARVFVWSCYQNQDAEAQHDRLPGYIDRKGIWRSTLASTAINIALDRVVVDYLLARPPCFLDEPYDLVYCLSYCDTRVHRGVLYRAAGFELFRTNAQGIQTWRKQLRPLSESERALVVMASERSARSRQYRTERALRSWQQGQLSMEAA